MLRPDELSEDIRWWYERQMPEARFVGLYINCPIYEVETLMPTQPNEHIFSNNMKIGKRPKRTAHKDGFLEQVHPTETEYFIESPLTKGAAKAVDWHATALFLAGEVLAQRSLVTQYNVANDELRTTLKHNAVLLHDTQNSNGKLFFALNQTTLRWPYKFLPRWLRDNIQSALDNT